MKNIFTLAVAVAALAFFATSQASAQGFNSGFQFGTGVNQSFGGGCCGGGARHRSIPYFAQFPPVYYNGIVRRPYGISPFAAPPGIEPVELRAIPAEITPVTIKNHFMKSKPVSAPAIKAKKGSISDTINKATWVRNPHFHVIHDAEALAFFEAK